MVLKIPFLPKSKPFSIFNQSIFSKCLKLLYHRSYCLWILPLKFYLINHPFNWVMNYCWKVITYIKKNCMILVCSIPSPWEWHHIVWIVSTILGLGHRHSSRIICYHIWYALWHPNLFSLFIWASQHSQYKTTIFSLWKDWLDNFSSTSRHRWWSKIMRLWHMITHQNNSKINKLKISFSINSEIRVKSMEN